MFTRRRRRRSLRIADAQLRAKILQLVSKLPNRSVATLRRLVGVDPSLAEGIPRAISSLGYRSIIAAAIRQCKVIDSADLSSDNPIDG
jgi:hypothetical protein